jgi:hypothetical protein
MPMAAQVTSTHFNRGSAGNEIAGITTCGGGTSAEIYHN